MRRTVLALSIAAAICAAPPAGLALQKTVGLVVDAYCESPTDVCGLNTEQQFRDASEQAVRDLNRYWKETGIVYRLQSVAVTYGGDMLTVVDGSGEPGQEAQLKLLNQLRATAAADPQHVYWFVLQNLGFCFSGIPGAFLGRTPHPDAPDEYYGVFCLGVDGNTMAHELGHHFCLAHPFTHEDPVGGATPNHDGDGFSDTAEDPGEVEYRFAADSAAQKAATDVVFTDRWSMCNHDPESCAIQVNGEREWCGWLSVPTDLGSYRPGHCTPLCRETDAGATSQGTGYAPDTHLIMSYYKGTCSGPYVYAGIPYGAFSVQERDRVTACATQGERAALVDVCAGKGDQDRDGLCDDEDPCPEHHASIYVQDTDTDGTPDVCDLCPADAVETVDTDNDGAGDYCDLDDDGDGCNDWVDDHPLDSQIPVGAYVAPGCPGSGTIYAYEGDDIDNDGLRDCEDPDNDGDGDDDVFDDCPNDPQNLCVIAGPDCGLQTPWEEACMGGGCGLDLDFLLRIQSVTLPAEHVAVTPLRVVGDVLYAVPAPERTTSEVAAWFDGSAFGLVEQGEKIRLDLVSKATGEVVTELGQYGLFSMEDAGFGPGKVVAVQYMGEVARGLMSVRIGTAWFAGSMPGAVFPDGDGDGVPDLADLCLEVADPAQRDTDGDGLGDACDPDLDNDGAVTAEDLDAYEACLGAVDPPPILPEPGQPPATPELQALSMRSHLCRGRDMNQDGAVTAEDLTLAEGWLGMAPGPAGMTEPLPEPVVNPEPDPEFFTESGPEVAPDVFTGTESFEVIGMDSGPDIGVICDTSVEPPPDTAPAPIGGEKGSGCAATGSGDGASLGLLFAALLALGIRRRRGAAIVGGPSGPILRG
jgi:hypothetical protein